MHRRLSSSLQRQTVRLAPSNSTRTAAVQVNILGHSLTDHLTHCCECAAPHLHRTTATRSWRLLPKETADSSHHFALVLRPAPPRRFFAISQSPTAPDCAPPPVPTLPCLTNQTKTKLHYSCNHHCYHHRSHQLLSPSPSLSPPRASALTPHFPIPCIWERSSYPIRFPLLALGLESPARPMGCDNR